MSRLGLLMLVWLALGGFGLSTLAVETRKLRVVTSFLPVYCFTANVAGEFAQVDNLLPANVEPHDYQFSRRELQALARADLIVANGLGLEQWLEKAMRTAISGDKAKIVEMGSGLEGVLLYAFDQPERLGRSGASLPNPHIWLDPVLASHAVTNILLALQEADPPHASGYARNAADYVTRLHRLDLDFQRALAPIKDASIVTYHAAFAYFARRYSLKVVGVVEPMPDFEPSLRSMTELYRSIRSHQVKTLFTESPAPSRLARQIASDLNLSTVQLDTLETGPAVPEAYERGMRNNLNALLQGLTHDAQRAFQ